MKWVITISCIIAVKLADARDIVLFSGGQSAYRIQIPAKATKQEIKASLIIQDYFKRVSGIELAIDNSDQFADSALIFLQELREGTGQGEGISPDERYSIRVVGKRVMVCGGADHGLLFGAYAFAEQVLGCRKLDGGEAYTPRQEEIRLDKNFVTEASPAFVYREVFFPESLDQEYLDWHGLHRFEERWGLWGHSFDKLIPPARYFHDHPEYYALINGRRVPGQLCLSNDTVFQVVVADLKRRMEDAGELLYWSVSPNDQGDFCTCDRCRIVDEAEGGPQGSLISFVNRIARVFPGKRITTLAYNQTKHPPLHIIPEKNVYVFVSTIDSYRQLPLSEELSAASFRKDLHGWKALTPNILVWDYVTQFTNYLVPFPNQQTFSANIRFFAQQQVKGLFMQGSGETRSDLQELKSYLLAKLLWNPSISVGKLSEEFIDLYYKKAAPHVKDYVRELQKTLEATHSRLDIYGNPVTSAAGYLSPVYMDTYSQFMDKADASAEGSSLLVDRVARIRLGHEYVYFQQARYFYREAHGIFFKADDGQWVAKDGFRDRVSRFCALSGKNGVLKLAEGGLPPDAYLREWEETLSAGYRQHKAEGATVKLAYPAVEDYMGGAPAVLTDGKPGFPDFSYNWLVFEDVPMIADIDLGRTALFDSLTLDFLHDPAHRYHVPDNLVVQYSVDGVSYVDLKSNRRADHGLKTGEAGKVRYIFLPPMRPVEARFIRISAMRDSVNVGPDGRQGSKLKIACDEVWLW